ncbi:MAG TPA: CHAD domain-containing protein [Blastocatellia bacterium]|nr:CHAD domain-containing protein [Blastocatellia bacterium]
MTTSGDPAPAIIPTGQFAGEVFTSLHRLIIAEEIGASEGEVEAIHDMRVAIRRLRVALGNFSGCLPREDSRRIRAQLETLADALGGVRDLDVMIEYLKDLLTDRPPSDSPAIKSLIRRLQGRRRRQYLKLIDYLGGEAYADFKREFPPPAETEGIDPEAEIKGESETQNDDSNRERIHGQAA